MSALRTSSGDGSGHAPPSRSSAASRANTSARRHPLAARDVVGLARHAAREQRAVGARPRRGRRAGRGPASRLPVGHGRPRRTPARRAAAPAKAGHDVLGRLPRAGVGERPGDDHPQARSGAMPRAPPPRRRPCSRRTARAAAGDRSRRRGAPAPSPYTSPVETSRPDRIGTCPPRAGPRPPAASRAVPAALTSHAAPGSWRASRTDGTAARWTIASGRQSSAAATEAFSPSSSGSRCPLVRPPVRRRSSPPPARPGGTPPRPGRPPAGGAAPGADPRTRRRR